MAGNKINAKSKGKEEKSNRSSGKVIDQNNEEPEGPDFSLLRKPILTSITGFGQARKIFDFATEELKTLLSNECDILYECKVCRNIFRSLANFISHKRVYCKEKFNSTVHGHFVNSSSIQNELLKIKHCEKNYQESLTENNLENLDTDDEDERVPLSKDLTEILEKIAKKNKSWNKNSEDPTVVTEKIPSSSIAVFQTVESQEDKYDYIRLQIKELQEMLSRDTAVLQNDGKFKMQSTVPQEPDNVIQISDDDDDTSNVLKCKTCDMRFATRKTLKYHMKYKHLPSRIVYPCPECLDIFSTSWSVFRHLYKVHRKTLAQVRRMREAVLSKAFRMNNPPPFYERRKNNTKSAATQKISEEERLDQENQAWMDNMEGDGEVPRCGGCGRTFERRAALAAHTHTCAPRTRALAGARPPRKQDHKRLQIQMRRDKERVNAALPVSITSPITAEPTDVDGTSITEVETQSPVLVPDSPKNDEEVTDKLENETVENVDGSDDEQVSGDVIESPEKMDCSIGGEVPSPVIRIPLARQAEKRNLAALRLKIQADIDLIKLSCNKCETRCNNIQELYDHTAAHYKWMRYACKLCNYKHYNFERLPEHVKVVHKLKGDKDFYFSTVKAIDGPEALQLSENVEEINETDDNSPDSRRPSRCSSDSSRLSDDSSSSSTRVEGGSRKRKPHQTKVYSKKRKESIAKGGEELKNEAFTPDKDNDIDSLSNIKTFEENSSDMDDVDDKTGKRLIIDTSSVASRRPVRRKAKPKNEDFEYDLSNLLKMEAQGYRDSQPNTTSKTYQTKKRIQQEIQINYDSLNKDCCGALVTLSKKAVEKSAAHMKVTHFPDYYTHKDHFPNIFVRPMIPKSIIPKGDKLSPKKDVEDKKDSSSLNSQQKAEDKKDSSSLDSQQKVEDKKDSSSLDSQQKVEDKKDTPSPSKQHNNDKISEDNSKNILKEEASTVENINDSVNKNSTESNKSMCEAIKPNLNIPAVVPIKFRRQSLEVIKNPLINKNIKDFTKTGLKTKILVIKPINRNQDGSKGSLATPLKFQTITLKDPNKSSSSEEKSSDQVVVVKVPKVECAITRTVAESTITNKEVITNTDSVKTDVDNQCNDLDIAKPDPAVPEKCNVVEKRDNTSENNCSGENDTLPNDSEPMPVEEKIINLDNENIVTDKCNNIHVAV